MGVNATLTTSNIFTSVFLIWQYQKNTIAVDGGGKNLLFQNPNTRFYVFAKTPTKNLDLDFSFWKYVQSVQTFIQPLLFI